MWLDAVCSKAFLFYFAIAAIFCDGILLPGVVGYSFMTGTQDYISVVTWAVAFTIAAFLIGLLVVSLANSDNKARRAWQLDVLADYGKHVFLYRTPVGLPLAFSVFIFDRVIVPVFFFFWTRRK